MTPEAAGPLVLGTWDGLHPMPLTSQLFSRALVSPFPTSRSNFGLCHILKHILFKAKKERIFYKVIRENNKRRTNIRSEKS